MCDASIQCNLDQPNDVDGDEQFVPLGLSTPQDDLNLKYTTKDGDVLTETYYLS